MVNPLDLTLLRSFVAVIDCGSIQRAADRVGRSQSAVSMQIKRLEEDVGRPLFQREGRSLRPNPAGEDLLIHARRLVRSWRGFTVKTITHSHFGQDPVLVYAIGVDHQ